MDKDQFESRRQGVCVPCCRGAELMAVELHLSSAPHPPPLPHRHIWIEPQPSIPALLRSLHIFTAPWNGTPQCSPCSASMCTAPSALCASREQGLRPCRQDKDQVYKSMRVFPQHWGKLVAFSGHHACRRDRCVRRDPLHLQGHSAHGRARSIRSGRHR